MNGPAMVTSVPVGRDRNVKGPRRRSGGPLDVTLTAEQFERIERDLYRLLDGGDGTYAVDAAEVLDAAWEAAFTLRMQEENRGKELSR